MHFDQKLVVGWSEQRCLVIRTMFLLIHFVLNQKYFDEQLSFCLSGSYGLTSRNM